MADGGTQPGTSGVQAAIESKRPIGRGESGHDLARRTSGSSSPFDPDWLLQRALLKDIARALTNHARGRLLDVGCGGRPYEAWIPAGVRYFGLETSASVASRPDAWGLATELPFEDGSFDTILCTQVIEHLAEPAAAFQEMARVLGNGGRLILTAPQAWFLHEEPFDFYRYTRFGLEHLCHKAGLEPVDVRSQGGFWALAGIFLAVHLGSYARWAAERGRRGAKSQLRRGVPLWRRILSPLRLPMALANLGCAALGLIPEPGIFAVNHLVVAEKSRTRLR